MKILICLVLLILSMNANVANAAYVKYAFTSSVKSILEVRPVDDNGEITWSGEYVDSSTMAGGSIKLGSLATGSFGFDTQGRPHPTAEPNPGEYGTYNLYLGEGSVALRFGDTGINYIATPDDSDAMFHVVDGAETFSGWDFFQYTIDTNSTDIAHTFILSLLDRSGTAISGAGIPPSLEGLHPYGEGSRNVFYSMTFNDGRQLHLGMDYESFAPESVPAVIPEPSAFFLLATGIAAMMFASRQRLRSARFIRRKLN